MSQTASCTTLAGKYNPLDYLAPSEVQPTGTRMCLPLARIRATQRKHRKEANVEKQRTSLGAFVPGSDVDDAADPVGTCPGERCAKAQSKARDSSQASRHRKENEKRSQDSHFRIAWGTSLLEKTL